MMKHAIDTFFSSPAYAVVGVSRNRRKFGNIIYRSMKERSFQVYPVNPGIDSVEGKKSFPSVIDLPDGVESVVTVVHPEATELVVMDCVRKGIKAIWMQLGSESSEAIKIANDYDIALVHGKCIIMFLEPVKSFHAVHRAITRLVGTYPR